jgi:hypothetical protein
MFQRLKPAPVSPLVGRRIVKQILSNSEGKPQGEDPLPAWAPPGPGKEGEQLGGRGVPPGHASVRRSASNTESGVISFIQR